MTKRNVCTLKHPVLYAILSDGFEKLHLPRLSDTISTVHRLADRLVDSQSKKIVRGRSLTSV